jgi:guanylate kinase
MHTGFLLIISAPSGAGKTTVCRRLLARDKSLRYSVSFTTRPPRAGEVPGRHYHFVSEEDFRRRARRGEFLETAVVHGNLYGTPRRFISEQVRAGRVVLGDIDVQGAAALTRRMPEAVTVFLLPPSWTRLEDRLRRRDGADESVERRLANARMEMSRAREYRYWIVNDALTAAVEQVESVIEAERLRSERRGLGGRVAELVG